MEEKIIIDRVNVAGCEYYKGKCMGYTHYCKIGCKECTDIGIKLCHYKQTEIFKAKIERLEQENEELKEELASFMNGDYCAKGCKKMNNAFQDAHKAILKENEELKEKIKAYDDIYSNHDLLQENADLLEE